MQLIMMPGIGARSAGDHQHRHAVEKASPMPLAAWVSPAAGTTVNTPIESDKRPTASAMNAPPPSWVTSTGVIRSNCSAHRTIRSCAPGNAEGEARADLLQRIDRKPGSGSFHVILTRS